MNNYLLIFRGGLDFKTASADHYQEAMLKWKTWIEKLEREGRDGSGHRLLPLGAVISGEKKRVTDGPYAEGKEIVGGFKLIKAKDLNDALEVAKGCPIFDYGGITEVREIAAP